MIVFYKKLCWYIQRAEQCCTVYSTGSTVPLQYTVRTVLYSDYSVFLVEPDHSTKNSPWPDTHFYTSLKKQYAGKIYIKIVITRYSDFRLLLSTLVCNR